MSVDQLIADLRTNDVRLTGLPADRSRLHLTSTFCIVDTKPKPNAWWRFWQFVLLGWRWEDVQ